MRVLSQHFLHNGISVGFCFLPKWLSSIFTSTCTPHTSKGADVGRHGRGSLDTQLCEPKQDLRKAMLARLLFAKLCDKFSSTACHPL